MNPFVDQWSQQNSNFIPNYNSESTNENFSESIKNVTDTTSKNTIQQANIINEKNLKNSSSKNLKDLFNYDEIFIAKLFYLLFYAAFGSLFPLMAVYYKQQGMSATQTGLLIGIRPFIEIFSTPFWVNLANRFSKGKVILIGSLISWIILTSALAFIRPPVAACITNNGTDFVIYLPYLEDNKLKQDNTIRKKRSVFFNSKLDKIKFFKNGLAHYSIYQNKKKKEIISYMDEPDYVQNLDDDIYLPPNHVIGISPLTIEYSLNYDDEIHSEFISPTFSQTVYKKNKVDEVFTLLMLLVLIGEFFAAPTITLVDTVTIKHLSRNINSYSKLRMFGSVGWALAMLFIGMALDNSTYFYNHPCGPHLKERNYNVCFKIFAILMTIACIVATKFNFQYNFPDSSIEMSTSELDDKNKKDQYTNNFEFVKSSNTNDKKFIQNNRKKSKFDFLDELKSGVFAQSFNKKLDFFPLLKCFTSPKLVALIFLAWFMGSGVGLVFSFLFWHLQDLGGTPSLFGLASVINHISEIAAYFGSLNYIKKYGHSRILCLGLICNFLRFLYISYIDNPWLILPFELVQGITHATVWATFCSYFNHTIPENSKNTSQALLQTIYNGFGKGLGSIFGGFLITAYGTRVTFAIYAFSSLITIGIFFLVMNVYNKQLIPTINLEDKKHEVTSNDKLTKNETNVNEYVTGLIPHGVPTGSINCSNSTKVFSQPTITNDKIKTNTYDDDLVDDYIKKNHRDWRITMNKHYK